jgi:type VI secretion system secreted protein VgrG
MRTLSVSLQIEDILADRVTSFEVERELGRPPTAIVDVVFSQDVGPLNAVGTAAMLRFGYEGEPPHEIVGIIESVSQDGTPLQGAATMGGGSSHAARFRLVSIAGLLEGSTDARIFQDKDVKEIVTAILEEHGLPTDKQKWQLTASYPKREYCVQYLESTLAFVSRLMEEEGIYFLTSNEDGQEVLELCDDSPSAAPIQGEKQLPFRGKTGFSAPGDAVLAIVEKAELCAGKITLRDYDFKRPALDLTAEAEGDAETDLERYDFPGLYVEPSEGKRLARVRLEAERAKRDTVTILADCPRLDAGRLVELVDVPHEDLAAEFLIPRVRHLYGQPAQDALSREGLEAPRDGRNIYVAEAILIKKEVNYRTPQTTPRPVIHGPQTARVVAPEGSEPESIHTDEHGRAKVKFHWDLAPEEDDKASCWMRVSQLQTSGSMILPRIGWEVIVEFLEGNPDRPVITGKLYNGLFMPPYALPEGKTRTSLQTRSTPGGNGANEIRLEDRAGGEEIMIRAQKDQTIATANDKKKSVGNNATRVVGGNETIDVGGNQTVKVTMGGRTTVGADQSTSVGGNRNVEVNAVSGLTAGGSSSVTVGGNHFEMDGNPLEALLNIATQIAIEAAQAAASQAMDQINGAIQSRVDQAMAPINNLTSQVEALGAGMEAARNGDLGSLASMGAAAAGLPVPPGFGGGDAGGGGGDGGGEASRGGGDGRDGGGGDAPSGAAYTEMIGLNQAVDSAIQRGITAGAGALGAALGLDSAGGGGSSVTNADGPVGDVGGISEADRAKGPGHNTHLVSANYTETVGSIRIQAALMGVNTEVGGNMTETVATAKVTGAIGDIVLDVGGNKTEMAMGRVAVVKGDEAETVGGNRMVMIGGAIYDKVDGGQSVTAGGPATFIGAFHKMEAATAITFSCGASEVVIDGSGVTITSPLIAFLSPKIQLTKKVTEA